MQNKSPIAYFSTNVRRNRSELFIRKFNFQALNFIYLKRSQIVTKMDCEIIKTKFGSNMLYVPCKKMLYVLGSDKVYV